VKIAFDFLDKNKDGYISCSELKELVELILQSSINEVEVKEFVIKNLFIFLNILYKYQFK
jgi:Ca2+-binding EF-hand superfamily protein